MYAAGHARPDGESTVSRLAVTAAEYGYDGLVVHNHGDADHDVDLGAVAEEYDVDVVDAVEVRAEDPSRASGYVGNYRPDRTLVCVHGGSVQLNRFAVEQPVVDVLAHPMDGGDFNHVLAKAAVENSVHVEFALGRVLRSQGGARVQALQDLRKLRELVEAFDVPFVVSTDARSHLHLRAPRELRALGEVVGFSADQIDQGLRAWGELAARNRERQSDTYVEPGVELVHEDGERDGDAGE